jgi:hypothetical protein
MGLGNVCYVIGGGPSLKGFDFGRLPQGYRIGANKSAWLANADCFITVDKNFHKKFRKEIGDFNGAKYASLNEDEPIEGVTYLTHERSNGLSTDPTRITGSNSGYAALNLAYQKGYGEIALLGFDFKWTDNQSHFHDGYIGQSKNTNRFLATWARAFDTIPPMLGDVKVINFVGPQGSNITAFPTRPLEDLI